MGDTFVLLIKVLNISTLFWWSSSVFCVWYPCQVSKVHKHQCSSLAVSEDGRFLLTAGHNAVKVWDYSMQLHVNSQVKLIGFGYHANRHFVLAIYGFQYCDLTKFQVVFKSCDVIHLKCVDLKTPFHPRCS